MTQLSSTKDTEDRAVFPKYEKISLEIEQSWQIDCLFPGHFIVELPNYIIQPIVNLSWITTPPQ